MARSRGSFPDFNQPEICSGVHPSASRSPTNRRKAASRSRIASRRSILDGVARGPGATRATAFVATRQITPQGRGLLCGPIDEAVDCLTADGPQPRFVPGNGIITIAGAGVRGPVVVTDRHWRGSQALAASPRRVASPSALLATAGRLSGRPFRVGLCDLPLRRNRRLAFAFDANPGDHDLHKRRRTRSSYRAWS